MGPIPMRSSRRPADGRAAPARPGRRSVGGRQGPGPLARALGRVLPGLLLGTPFLWLAGVVAFAPSRLGPDPADVLIESTGLWALRGLVLVLALPVLVRLAGHAPLARHRRSIGVAAGLYAVLHFALFVWLVLGGDLSALGREIVERPYVLAGMSSLVLLLPLLLTSTRGWMRRLGRRWKQLHRGVYPAAVLASLHFVWLSRGDYTEPAVYALLVSALLGWRVLPERWRWPRMPPRRAGAQG